MILRCRAYFSSCRLVVFNRSVWIKKVALQHVATMQRAVLFYITDRLRKDIIVKFLTDVKDIKALKKAIGEAQYYIDSATVGTVNAYFMFTDNGLSYDSWIAETEADSKEHLRILAFGNADKSRVLCCNISEQFKVELFGAGKRRSGRILFIQREGDSFNVVYDQDNFDGTECLKMTVTSDAIMVQILLLLVQELFPSVEATTISKVLGTLTESTTNEEVTGDGNS